MKPDLSSLRYFVLCKSSQAFFETIAGFDCKPPALAYITDCRNGQRTKALADRFLYRLVDVETREVAS